MNSVVG
jgi:hypothetical protein